MAVSTALALALAASTAGAARAQSSFAAGVHIGPSGRASVDLAFFHSDLAPYGRWVDVATYGRVFVPRHHHRHWRPYLYGHWAYTDYGWTWVSAEPFGWATYHYGRWTFDPDYGWIWVPGTEWGPAWVDWQEGDSYVGWAPLPPTVGYNAGVGLDLGGFELGVDLAPSAFVFVPERSFLVSDVSSYCLPPQDNVRFFNRTRNITQYTVVNDRIFNRGLPLTTVERVTGRRVSRYQVADLGRAGTRQRFQGNRVSFFRPMVNAPANARTAERLAAESRRANSPVRQAVRQGAAAHLAAVQGRRAVQANRQAAVAERQQVQGRNQRQRIAERAQEERQQQRAQAQGQRARIASRAQAQRERIATRAETQRGNERAHAQAQRQQIAARSQAERRQQRAQANVERQQQRAQASRNRQRSQAQAERNQQRAQAQAERHQQQAARAQARPQHQPQQRPQVAQRQRQQQRPHGHGKPQDNSGGQSQRRGHGAF
jgi:hypothetical protein